MANRTVKDALSIKGTNPQYLVEKIIRTRIYDSRYWKEDCFGLSAELLVDKAMELKSIGGIYGGNVKPTPFLCLILKMLQIQPEKDIIVEFIRNEDFKYVRALGAFYMRLTGNSLDVYKYLEPLYIDYRKMKRLNKNAKYELVHMDTFIDELLHSERVCDISLPRIQKRSVLEETNELETRISPLDINLNDIESSSDESSSNESVKSEASVDKKKKSKEKKEKKKPRNSRSRSRSRSRERKRSRSREKKSSKSIKYVDYDNPSREDLEFYGETRRPRRSRTRSRSRSPNRHKSSKSSRHRSRTRSRSRSRSNEKKKSSKKHRR